MRGHVRKRGNRWAFVVELGHDPESGKRRQRWHSGYERKLDAERALAEALAKLAAGGYVEPSKLTVGRFLEDEWLPAIRATVRPNTHAAYERMARVHIIPRLGGTPLQRLTSARVSALYAELTASGRRDGEGLAPASVRLVHSTLHRALAAAVKWQLITRNPGDDAELPALADEPAKAWPAAELSEFLRATCGDRLYPLWHLLAQTGARRHEALDALWADIDFDAARWSIPRAKTRRGRRTVALDPGTVRVLRDWRKRQLEERLAWGPAYRDRGLVFAREDGEPLRPDTISAAFTRAVVHHGLPALSLHGLRHTHASLALRAGINPKVVSERLGHSSVAMTMDVYSHCVPGLQEDAAATVAALVGLD